MDTEPDFSIITPSYNYARYVKECIESVKNQEGVTFEHIIQDAGSTDGTLDILHSYPHLKLHVERIPACRKALTAASARRAGNGLCG